MRLHRDERGQTIILVALSLPLMLGFVGIATDVGSLFKDKRDIQTAADAAAIAGALNYNYGYTAWTAAANSASAANGFTNGSNGVTVTTPPTPQWASSGFYQKSPYVEVTITKTEPTIFLALFGHPTVSVLARAVATNAAQGSGCLYTVGATGTTFTINGNVTLNAPSCGLVVESNDPTAMLVHGSSGSLTLGSIGVVGGYSGPGPPNVTPAPVTGIAPESDPLNYLPQYACTQVTSGHGAHQTTTYSCACASGYSCAGTPITSTTATTCSTVTLTGNTTLSPLSSGCYAGLDFSNATSVTVNPGVYVINGDLTFGTGTVTGSGVTFYYTGQLTFGSGTYNLAAPNDPTQLFNGILFAESISDTDAITFGGNSNTVIKGVVYAPGTSLTMAGTPSLTLDADFVVQNITLSGDVNFTSYASLSGISSPLSSIALVE
jgi:Flp pilus assembly protein TadG